MKLKILNDHKGYWFESSESTELDLLYLFLTEFYNIYDQKILYWLSTPDPNFKTSNALSVFFCKENKMFQIEDEVFREEENILTISQSEIIKIISKWEELLKQKPDEIVITQDENKSFILIGKFVDGREI